MLLQPVLVQAGEEGELIAGRGGIEDGLRVFTRLDLMFGREEGGGDEAK
jgi:hypothetical protein